MRLTALMMLSVACLGAGADFALGAEGATGFYLLGSKTSMPGVLPPPGTYVQETNYYYSGHSNAELEIGGLTVSGGVNADAFYTMPTAIWVAPDKFLGGNVAFSIVVPVGWKDVRAGVSLTGPLGNTIATNVSDDDLRFGDPVPGVTLGWHDGNYHWNVGALVNAPAGYWKKGNLSNIGFNRWAVDLNGAATYLDTKSGLEVSSAVGFTFNFENPATDYTTGTEFHLEFDAMQNLSKTFAVGIAGYYYDQITGDSGAGARLGDFEGRVFALGPAVNINCTLGKIPVSANLRYNHEFDVKNRLEGDAGLLNVSMPLSVAGGGH